jgi:hypothetical protein
VASSDQRVVDVQYRQWPPLRPSPQTAGLSGARRLGRDGALHATMGHILNRGLGVSFDITSTRRFFARLIAT